MFNKNGTCDLRQSDFFLFTKNQIKNNKAKKKLNFNFNPFFPPPSTP